MSVLQSAADELRKRYPQGRGRSTLIPLLHKAEERDGYVTTEAMAEIAELLGLTAAEVRSVATFYTMLHLAPKGRHVVSVCHNLACSLMGAERVIDALEKHLGARAGENTSDGEFTLERAECLAFCDKAPMLQIDYDTMHGPLTSESAISIVEGVRGKVREAVERERPLEMTPPRQPVEIVQETVTAEDEPEPSEPPTQPSEAAIDLFPPDADEDFVLEEVIVNPPSASEVESEDVGPQVEQPADGPPPASEPPPADEPPPGEPRPAERAEDPEAELRGKRRRPYAAERLLDIEIDEGGVGPGPADPRTIGAPLPKENEPPRRPRGAE